MTANQHYIAPAAAYCTHSSHTCSSHTTDVVRQSMLTVQYYMAVVSHDDVNKYLQCVKT
jgi:hypothetical protein